MRARQFLPHLVVDGLFAVLYLGAVLASFPLTIYTCNSFAFPPYLRVTASIENVSSNDELR